MLTLLFSAALADSPLTSIDLSVGYPASEGVKLARDGMSPAVARYLLGDHPLGERIAVVDALGWQGSGRAQQLLAAIAEKRGRKSPDDLRLADVLPAERVLLGYLLAHDDYLELGPMVKGSSDDLRGATPLALATSGANALPDDFAAQAAVALIDAQGKMDGSWCAVWTSWRTVLERFPDGKRNLPAQSVSHATEYMKLYEDDCGPAVAGPESPELNEVYTLATYDGRLVAGTQGGVVVWKDGRPESVREEMICGSLAVYRGALYAGCYHRLLKYDGEWTTVSFDSETREGGTFAVYLDHEGELVVMQGAREHRLNDGKLAATGVKRAGHDLEWAPDGSVWSIDFLQAVRHGKQTWPLQSGGYPGRDPRRFYTDPRGTLWVVDFESGFFAYDRETGAFRSVPGVDTKASAMAVDADRDRVWLLHYTQGLVVLDHGEAYDLDLSGLEYMRDMLLAPDGSVWVGGWNSIVRVAVEGGRLVEKEKLRL